MGFYDESVNPEPACRECGTSATEMAELGRMTTKYLEASAEADTLRAEVERLRAEAAGPIPPRVTALYRFMAAQWRAGATVVPIERVRDILSGRSTAGVVVELERKTGDADPAVRVAARTALAELARDGA